MIKKILFSFIIFMMIFQTNLFSQKKSENHLGIGMSLDPSRIGHVTLYSYGELSTLIIQIINSSPYLFYVPININDKFRIEPVFGINSLGNENTDENRNTNNPYYSSTTNKFDGTLVTLGIGIFYSISPIESLNLYFGPRFLYYIISSTNERDYVSVNQTNTVKTIDKTTQKENDMRIGLAFGAEYFPISHLSIGGEISLNYTSYGNPKLEETSIPVQQPPPTYIYTNKLTQHSFRTDGLFFLRWYFL